MSDLEMSGTIRSLITFYKVEKRIFGRCPNCGEPFRLSDVKLTYGKMPPRDLLSKIKSARDKLQAEVDALTTELEEIEEDRDRDLDAVEMKWKERVELEVDKRMMTRGKEIRQKAIAQSRAGQLGKTLEKLVPMFPGFGHHPYDVRPIFDPVDFVVFDGYYQGSVTDICFVEFKTGGSRINPVQASIRRAIDKGRVHFQEKRLSKDAIELLTEGKSPRSQKLIRRIIA